MSQMSPMLERLIQALKILPGVGQRSAQRMAFHLLSRNRVKGEKLGELLKESMQRIRDCRLCRTFSEHDVCGLCSNAHRDRHKICVVETPADILAIEMTQQYTGLYFVLRGHLSPIEGVMPEDLGLPLFDTRLAEENFIEVILATNPTVEGDITAHYIAGLCGSHAIRSTRIAHGVPVGGDLEMVDGATLSHALMGRKPLERDA